MRGGFAAFILLFILGPTSVHAMRTTSDQIAACHIVGSEKLPVATGGSAAVCSEIERAISAAAPRASYKAEVRILSNSRMTADLVVNGSVLPEQRFAIMDSELNFGAIQRFAASLASAVAAATKATK